MANALPAYRAGNVEAQAMPLDPSAKRILTMVAAGAADRASLTPDEMRKSMLRLSEMLDARDVSIARATDLVLPGPAGELKARLYDSAPAQDRSPGLIYFHGGTGVFGAVETHEGLCRMLANSSGCRILSIDYRLAPEHPFPAAVDDAYASVCWAATHARALGIDKARLAVGGDSSGGTLATVVCQLARAAGGPDLALQFLLCPVTDLRCETQSRRNYGSGYFFDMQTLDWAIGLYCPDHATDAEFHDPRLSPMRARDLSRLPPALIHTAEFDPLRDEGRAYADRLAEANVKVHYECHAGMIHHFYAMAGAIPRARAAIEAMGTALRDALAYEVAKQN